MITIANYFKVIKNYNIPKTQKSLHNGMKFVNKITQNGKTWDEYYSVDWIRNLIDQFLKELNAFVDSNPKTKKALENKTDSSPVMRAQAPDGDTATKLKTKSRVADHKIRTAEERGRSVPRLSEAIRIIRRFLYMNNKEKTINELRYFLNHIQRAINQKKVHKTTPHSAVVMEIQDSLIKVIESNFYLPSVTVYISEGKENQYLKIIAEQKENASVKIINGFIELQARPIDHEIARKFYNGAARMINRGLVSLKDKYWKQLEKIMLVLRSFVFKNPNKGYLLLTRSELHGMPKAKKESTTTTKTTKAKDKTKGINGIPQDSIMNSMDIVNLKIDTLGFKGKWRDFFGDPVKGFSVMVYGMPKFGKSTFCLEFAGYLARNHGKVLYVANEEQISGKLIQKLREHNVAHPNLDSVGTLPYDLSGYDFVFLDSVTKLGFTPGQLSELHRQYPEISFIDVFQVTKQGAFRGGNGFQHEVDSVVEFPQKGYAIQYGRFNQGGEMQLFN